MVLEWTHICKVLRLSLKFANHGLFLGQFALETGDFLSHLGHFLRDAIW